MDAFFLALSRAGFGLAIQSTVLLALGLIVGAFLRRQSPNARVLVYRGTFAAVTLGAALSLALAAPLSNRTLISLPEAYAGLPLIDTHRVSLLVAPSPQKAGAPEPRVEPASWERDSRTSALWQTVAKRVTPGALIAQIWAFGAALLLAWMLGCHVSLVRLRRRCSPITDPELSTQVAALCMAHDIRGPELLCGAGVRGPFLTGLWRPAIVLPETYREDFPEGALRAVLVHEVAHLVRRDCWWSLGARLIAVVGWMQPLVWVLCRRNEQAVEEACDVEVVRQGCAAHEYARCLVDFAERLTPLPAARVAGATVVPSRSSLGQRVTGIMKRGASPDAPLPGAFRAGIGLGVFAAAAGAIVLVSTSWTPARSAVEKTKEALTGKVLAKDGKPLKGLRVLVSVHDAVEEQRINRTGFGDVEADGTYRIEGLADGEAIISLHRPSDRVAPAVRVQIRDGKAVAPDLVLEEGGEIQGVVHDRTGEPLEGLCLTVEGPDRPPGFFLHRSADSDTHGHFTIKVSPGKHLVTVLGPVDWSRVGDDKGPPETKLEVTVSKGEVAKIDITADERYYGQAVITGKVAYPDGKPAGGIRVMAQLNHGYFREGRTSFRPGDGKFSWGEDVSRPDGSYRIKGLMTAPYNVSVEDPKDEWIAAAAENVPAVLRTTFRPADLKLTPGAFVQGTVTDVLTGKPVKGCPIGSYGPHRPKSSAMIIRTETDEKGRYRLRVAPGESYVYVQDPRYSQDNATITLKEGETREQPFKVTVPGD